MSTSTLTYPRRRTALWGRVADYIELTKPRIAALELLTVLVGAGIACSGVPSDGWLILHLLGGTALVAASASALNQWLERDTDGLMRRTADRPLPAGRLTPTEVIIFGAITGSAGLLWLLTLVGPVTAALGLLTWLLYVWVYTPLKTRSSANTFIGAVAGALPAMMGYAALAPANDAAEHRLLAATLFLLVFLWQFPHFMAIAWLYRDSYTAGGMKMLPVVDPTGRRAGAQAVLSAAVLVPISLLPTLLMRAGSVYFLLALVLSVFQLACAVSFALQMNDITARRLLRASLVYLPMLMALLLTVPLVYPHL
ncbi:MAG: heme o synthase [Planctomycetes bacterium]|nr:heme o synthase [Planctomycetota bacterium]